MFNKPKRTRCKAFTLIELLVVISIILIASSIIFIGGNSGGGASLSSSLRIVSGIAQGARGQAILKNAETRLIIHNDPTDLEKYRRYFGIVYWGEDVNSSGVVTATGWKAATQGTSLPEGIYFDPSISNQFGANRNGMSETISLDYPRISVGANTDLQSGAGSTSYYQYAFNSNGTSANPNEWLAIRAGNLNADGDLVAYDSTGENGFLKAALIFRQAGTTTPVTDPDAVQ
ncbi:MAG: prepilin-type N-terminal cleavage/methylation domain-containing protein [Opitutae bacterium]|nr:prepilin-type N-terminal cleavage/methylation domain-containing protein [Opitutae bacterium]